MITYEINSASFFLSVSDTFVGKFYKCYLDILYNKNGRKLDEKWHLCSYSYAFIPSTDRYLYSRHRFYIDGDRHMFNDWINIATETLSSDVIALIQNG